MQSHEPLKEVLDAVRDGSWREKAQIFEFEVDMGMLSGLRDEIRRTTELVGQTGVEVEPKPRSGEDGKDNPPGNS